MRILAISEKKALYHTINGLFLFFEPKSAESEAPELRAKNPLFYILKVFSIDRLTELLTLIFCANASVLKLGF